MNALSYLVDTDWVIDHLNEVHRVRARLQQARESGVAISVISLAELWQGIHFSYDAQNSERKLREFLSDVSVLGVTVESCKRFGWLRGTLQKQGIRLPDFDLLIAATALEHNLTLFSNNRRHFERIPGLRIESV